MTKKKMNIEEERRHYQWQKEDEYRRKTSFLMNLKKEALKM